MFCSNSQYGFPEKAKNHPLPNLPPNPRAGFGGRGQNLTPPPNILVLDIWGWFASVLFGRGWEGVALAAFLRPTGHVRTCRKARGMGREQAKNRLNVIQIDSVSSLRAQRGNLPRWSKDCQAAMCAKFKKIFLAT